MEVLESGDGTLKGLERRGLVDPCRAGSGRLVRAISE